MTLIDRLKVAMGRKLSPKVLEEVKNGAIITEEKQGHDGGHKIKIKRVDNQIHKITTYNVLATTPDASEGNSRMHTGYYPVGEDESFYDLEGRIIAKQSRRNGPASFSYKNETKVYSNNSVFGKTADRYHHLLSATQVNQNVWAVTEITPSNISDSWFDTPLHRVSLVYSDSDKKIGEIKF